MLSLAAHGLALATLLVELPDVRRPDAAVLEVKFGRNADVAGAAPMRSVATSSQEPSGVATNPDVTVASGGDVGLDIRRDDEGVVEATADPHNAAPHYPETAVARQESGSVVWRIFVNSDGRVDHIAPVRSSSYRDLDDAARVAFLRWHFRAAHRDGAPVASSRDLTANFVLP